MNIALKKIELIEWLSRLQDEKLIKRIEALRQGSAKDAYEVRIPRTPEELKVKLDRSDEDIREGRVHSQREVDAFFKMKLEK
jgi:hypothetical protein